jgi:intracellular sulfur oxidation DsrE/DsrF family protein
MSPSSKDIPMKPKVVFHIDSNGRERLDMILTSIRNILDEVSDNNASIFVIAEAESIVLFRKDMSPSLTDELLKLRGRGVHFLLCEQSAMRQGLGKSDLIPDFPLIKSGIWELIRLQHEGFAYVKP